MDGSPPTELQKRAPTGRFRPRHDGVRAVRRKSEGVAAPQNPEPA